MEFKITGHVREKESGLGVRGLMIRAYDKDLLYDDLLGTAVTDDEGRFEMIYTEKDYRELFEGKPDIYLSVYAPPWRFLIDTKKAVRWEASAHEHFELEIDREGLGNLAPTRPDDRVEGGISFLEDAITIEKRHQFDVPKLPGFTIGGPPGAPALPEQIQYVALPLGGDVLSLEVIPGDPVRMPEEMTPFPVQEAIPDIGTDPEQFGDGFSIEDVDVRFTPPNPKYFATRQPYPESLVELERVEEIGAIQLATVRICPLQYDPGDRAFIFYPNLRYVVRFDLAEAKRRAAERDRKGPKLGRYYTEQLDLLLKQDLVVSAADLFFGAGPFYEELPHVIITDNYAWPEFIDRGDGTTRPPDLSERGAALPVQAPDLPISTTALGIGGAAGDLVAEFERLAEWRTSRGLRSRVVTISDIVGGNFGDFTEGGFARDLQEVLRNFIKYIHKEWGTLCLLLAGDVNVVPMRQLTGVSTHETIGCGRHTDNPPPVTKCHFVTGKAAVKIFPLFTPVSTDPLSTNHGGTRVPFDREAGSGRLGWYYTTEVDFTTKDEGFTRLPAGQTSRYIIVEGPESVIDDGYYWVRTVNSIPSDLYYADLIGSRYSIPGKHDFDSNNNGLYGQYHWDEAVGGEVTLDGVHIKTLSEVRVGRASVESEDQARAFVDKVMTYERLETPDGAVPVDLTYLRKVLYASAYFYRREQSRQSDTWMPPEPDRFTHEAGTNVTKIRTGFSLSLSRATYLRREDAEEEAEPGLPPTTVIILSHRLVARLGTTAIAIPYNEAADESNLGWYFTHDDTYTSQSTVPTLFVKVLGPETDINADWFFWDPVGLEQAVQEKERLRAWMNDWYPNLDAVERHYEDYFDLSSPPPLVPLEANTVRAALDSGVHFASLTGHGSPAGCCWVNTTHDFSNTNKYFIMYAMSCSTARPDGVDSLAERSTYDPDGGAVAYVGFTRYGWSPIGARYEEGFWDNLKAYMALGPAAALRSSIRPQFWTMYSQTLFGDPGMWVWTDVPSIHEVTHPETVKRDGTITVTVRELAYPVAGHRVTLMGGWTNSSVRPPVFMTKTTNQFGKASFTVSWSDGVVDQLRVTVTHPNFKPYVGTLTVSS